MPLPIIYFDECADQSAIPYLQARGVTVKTPGTEGTRSLDDPDQLRFAASNGWVLLTTNRRHFHGYHDDFLASGEGHGGIITVPQNNTAPIRFRIRCALMVDWVAQDADGPRNRLYRWTDLQEEIKRGDVPGAYAREVIRIALGQQVP